MTADALKSASITNLDASPVVANTTGNGAAAELKQTADWVTPTAAGLADTTSKYKFVRLPFNAKLKALSLDASAPLDTNGSPTLAVDVGAYYSDSTVDGTPVALQGTAISVNAFCANKAFGASGNTLKFNALQSLSVEKRNQELWAALGLSSNPGGFVDIVVAWHVGAATASSQNVMLTADWAA